MLCTHGINGRVVVLGVATAVALASGSVNRAEALPQGGCFTCEYYMDQYGVVTFHNDYHNFANDLHGTFHGPRAPGPCAHMSYTT